MELQIEHLTKKYGEKTALRDFTYTFTPPAFMASWVLTVLVKAP